MLDPRQALAPDLLFFSSLLGREVLHASGVRLGRLVDLVVVPGEPYPPVESLVVGGRGGERLRAPWSGVRDLAQRTIRLQPGVDVEAMPDPMTPDRLLLGEEILDRQIVDVEGAKLVRVNDLHFLAIKGTLRLAHVDVGFRGLVRRLGWQRPVDSLIATLWPKAPYLGAETLLPWKLVQSLGTSHGRVRLEVAQRQLAEIHPADLAEIMKDLDQYQRVTLFRRLDVETAADTLEESSPAITSQLINEVPPERAADILEEMAPDEAADLLGDLPQETRQELLQRMERPDACEVQALLDFAPRSAGGLMTPEFVSLPPDTTVEGAISEIRHRAGELPLVYEIFVADDGAPLQGLCTLKDLIAADPSTTLRKLMREAPAVVGLEANAREVAEVASKYSLLSVPVVDDRNNLRGIVTIDDILSQVLHGN